MREKDKMFDIKRTGSMEDVLEWKNPWGDQSVGQ